MYPDSSAASRNNGSNSKIKRQTSRIKNLPTYLCPMKFADYPLSPEIKRSIGKQGWRRPTDIQYKAIRPILEGQDVLAVAQTGTGKTAAFASSFIPTS